MREFIAKLGSGVQPEHSKTKATTNEFLPDAQPLHPRLSCGVLSVTVNQGCNVMALIHESSKLRFNSFVEPNPDTTHKLHDTGGGVTLEIRQKCVQTDNSPPLCHRITPLLSMSLSFTTTLLLVCLCTLKLIHIGGFSRTSSDRLNLVNMIRDLRQ